MSKPVTRNLCSLKSNVSGRPTYPRPMMPILAVLVSILRSSRSAVVRVVWAVGVITALVNAFLLPTTATIRTHHGDAEARSYTEKSNRQIPKQILKRMDDRGYRGRRNKE